MDPLTLYHRSYLDVTKYAKAAYERPDTMIGSSQVPRRPVQGSVGGFMQRPNGVRPMDLYGKPGQQFGDFATQWERNCSVLAGKKAWAFSPVVASKEDRYGFPVIAHHATIPGDFIAVPRKSPPGEYSLTPLLDKGIPAFAYSFSYPDAGDWKPFSMSIMRYTVLTDVEGGIIAQLGRSDADGVEPSDIFAYIAIFNIVAHLGAYAGKRLITALARRSARTGAAEILNAKSALARARAKWGTARVIGVMDGGAATASELAIARPIVQRAIPEIVDVGTNKIRLMTLREVDAALRNSGFQVLKVEVFPKGSAGYQIFYQNGPVIARFKTIGDAAGPRAGVTNISFSLTNGKGVDWTNELAKFSAKGNPRPKSVVPPDRFKPGKDFQGNDQRMIVIDSNFTPAAGDQWGDSVHFNAPTGFRMDGLDDVLNKAPKGQ
jgi:hypothetical protein